MMRLFTFLFFFFSLQVFSAYGYSTSYNLAPSGTNCGAQTVNSSNGVKDVNDATINPAPSSGNFACSSKGFYDGLRGGWTALGTSFSCPGSTFAGGITYAGPNYSVICMKEDSTAPSTSNISYTAGRTNSPLTITVQGQDNAMLDRMDLYEWKSGAWQLLRTWGALGAGSTPTTRVYIKPVENGLDTKYFVRAYDRVGRHTDSAVGGDVHFDSDAPTNVNVTYATGRKNSAVTITYQGQDQRNLKKLELRQYDGSSWTMVDSVDNLNSVNTLKSRTWTRNTVEGPTYNYQVIAYDIAGNQTPYTNLGIIQFDTTPPVDADISFTPALTQGLFATNSQNISVSVSPNGGSPVDDVEAKFEKWNVVNSYLPLSSGPSPLPLNVSMQNVDSERGANGGRSYRLLVTKVCDRAGNCLFNPFGGAYKEYFVYANTTTLSQVGANKTVTTNQLETAGNVADATTKNLTLTLKDKYGNIVIPASGISRQVNFTFDVLNKLYLDQYLRSGPTGVFLNIPSDNSYLQRIPIGGSVSQSFSNQTSSDGTYNFGFKVYSPTHQNTLADPLGQFNINDIKVDTSDTIGSQPSQLVDNSSNIDLNFLPLYGTTITGQIRTDGFIEGVVASNAITVTKAASPVTPSSRDLYVEFGSGARLPSASMNLKFGSTNNPTTLATEGAQSSILNVSKFTTSDFITTTYDFFTKLLQESGVPIDPNQKSYLSTHITYLLDGNRITYNSDIVGKNNYFDDTVIDDNSNQVGVKITGISTSKNQSELIQNQFTQDVEILGNVYKTALKKGIVSNIYNLIKSVTPVANGTSITNLTNFGSNTSGVKLANDSILYYGSLSGTQITLGNGINDKMVSGVKTIVVIGGDLYIKSNMYYQDKTQDIIGVIVLKDENGNGGNLYIDPSVTNIVGTYVLDKSVISYDGTKEFDGNSTQSELKNQLHIFGNIFSENTLGGSRSTPLKCPYYVSSCTQEIAQKYDLNFLRRYVLNTQGVPVGVGKVIGGGTCTDTGTKDCIGGNASFVRNIVNVGTDPYAKYPIVIEYNPLISKIYPPLFSQK